MGHVIIVGTTESGKTTLAKDLCASYRRRGIGTIVLDPHKTSWDADLVTSDPERFLAAAKASERCAIFLDEGRRSVGRGVAAARMEWTTTEARHWGHRAHLMVQMPQQIDPTIRSQAVGAFVFRCGSLGAKMMAEELVCPQLANAPTLGQYEFYAFRPFKPLRRMRLALKTGLKR